MFKENKHIIQQKVEKYHQQLKILVQYSSYNWQQNSRHGDSVYLIDVTSFTCIKTYLQKMASGGIIQQTGSDMLINECIIQKEQKEDCAYSQAVLKSKYRQNKQTINTQIIILNKSINDIIFKKLSFKGIQIQRKVFIEKGIKYIQWYPKVLQITFINLRIIQNALKFDNQKGQKQLKLPNLTKIKLNIYKDERLYKLKKRIHKICQEINFQISYQYRIYQFNKSLFQLVPFQQIISYYYLKEDFLKPFDQNLQIFNFLTLCKSSDSFMVEIFPGKLINDRNFQIIMKNTNSLVIQLKDDQQWLFPDQQENSIAIQCSYCLIKYQSFTEFSCQNCKDKYYFCSRLCHYLQLRNHQCKQAQQSLNYLYYTPVQQSKQQYNNRIDNNSSYVDQSQGSNMSFYHVDNNRQIEFNRAEITNQINEQYHNDHSYSAERSDQRIIPIDNSSFIADNNLNKSNSISIYHNDLSFSKQQSFNQYGKEIKLNLKDNTSFKNKNDSRSSNNSIVIQSMGGGLYNLGNTCYMNAAIQNLFRTQLTDQILKSQRRIIGNLNSHLCQGYMKIIKKLLGMINTQSINGNQMIEFKDAVDKTMSLFEGFEQQDAHQFILFFFDRVNQQFNDGNQKKKRKFQPKCISMLSPQKKQQQIILARLNWLNFIHKSHSPVINSFYGQLRQQIHCPYCKHSYKNFEPFSMISLAIPENLNERRLLYEQYPFKRKIKQYLIQYTGNTIKDLFVDIKKKLSIKQNKIEQYKLFLLSYDQKPIYFEDKSQSLQILKTSSKYLRLFLFHCEIQKPTIIYFSFIYKYKAFTFKRPFFFVQKKREIRYMKILYIAVGRYLCKIAQIYITDHLSQIKKAIQQNIELFFKLHIFTEQQIANKKSVLYNRYKSIDSQITNDIVLLDYEVHIQLLQFHLKYPKFIKFHEIILSKLNKSTAVAKSPLSFPLQACLQQEFNRQQILGNGNEWLCHNCNVKRRVHKTTALYKANKYMIVHLKRFRNVDNRLTKNKIKINIPLKLDIKGILHNHSLPETYFQDLDISQSIQLGIDNSPINSQQSSTFSLIGMILHTGDGLKRGHYYAICKNSTQGWSSYNDQSVEPIKLQSDRLIDSLSLQNIYILFYERTFTNQNK